MELNGMGHIWSKFGSDMGRAMVHICLLCGFDMGYSPTYQTHRCLFLSLCCLLLWDDYIFREGPITFSIAFCLGMVWVCPIAITYDPHPVLWVCPVFRKVPYNSHSTA